MHGRLVRKTYIKETIKEIYEYEDNDSAEAGIKSVKSTYQKEGQKEPDTDTIVAQVPKYDPKIYSDFFEGEDIQITGNKKDCETIITVYEVFKVWYRAVYDSKPPNKKEFLEYLAGSDRFHSDKKYIYGIKFNYEENKIDDLDE